ncbi:homogentisate 1-2-dioxygenase [Penicillium pulvis]|uniref:homogentisate 1-2-dioxygenase n=1 Tax=Penicillium pulvis TaxID=1562058 RepID=UPI002546C4C0|nr:homogentisate 1-2-dioxygenase [Penicillium pulvis]KAJ5809562.1 homogentisate 1-2-dioxygenase [Penicillium pulvis]
MAFMMHISSHVSLTDYALERSGKLQHQPVEFWDDFKGGFMDHLEEINAHLEAAGRPILDVEHRQ